MQKGLQKNARSKMKWYNIGVGIGNQRLNCNKKYIIKMEEFNHDKRIDESHLFFCYEKKGSKLTQASG